MPETNSLTQILIYISLLVTKLKRGTESVRSVNLLIWSFANEKERKENRVQLILNLELIGMTLQKWAMVIWCFQVIFPSLEVVELLLACGADVNARNESKSTPLHIASMPYNFNGRLVHTLLENGAHLDQPNRADDRPMNMISANPGNEIYLINYISLKCLASTVITKYRIPYRNQIPKTLEMFVRQHEA